MRHFLRPNNDNGSVREYSRSRWRAERRAWEKFRTAGRSSAWSSSVWGRRSNSTLALFALLIACFLLLIPGPGVARADDLTGTITADGTAVTANITVAGQNASYTFSGTGGQVVSLNASPSTVYGATIKIRKPDGSTLASQSWDYNGSSGGYFIDKTTLPSDGTYTVFLDPSGSNTGSTTLHLYTVPADAQGSITLGTPVSISAGVPGQNFAYTFTGTSGELVSLKVTTTLYKGTISLRKSDGTVLPSGSASWDYAGSSGGYFVDRIALPADGTYTAYLDPAGSNTASATFAAYQVPVDAQGSITLGTPVSISAGVPGQNYAYTFTGSSGQRVSLNAYPNALYAGTIKILKPDGSTLASQAWNYAGSSGGYYIDTQTLPSDGTYTAVLDPASSYTGAVTFAVYNIPADAQGSIIFGTPKSVAAGVPGQNFAYTFTSRAGQVITVGDTNSIYAGVISIKKPDGSTLTSSSWNYNGSSGSRNIGQTTLPVTGTYTLYLDPSGANTGTATLTLQVAFPSGEVPATSAWVRGGWNDAVPGLVDPCQRCADPVNSENGDFSESVTDASVATFGPGLSFTRTYDALLAQAQAAAGTPGPLGYGWTENWNMSLSVSSGVVTITQANGAQVSFKAPVSGSCASPYLGSGASGTYCQLPGVTARLTYDSGSSTYTFITHPYASYTFNASGQLTGETTAGGAALTASYGTPSPGSGGCPGSASSCDKVTSASGRALVIAKNSSGRIIAVVDPLGRTWTYAYCSPPSSTCSTNDLVSVTDPLSNVTSFTYDQGNSSTSLKHDLLTMTAPNGQSGGSHAGAKLVNVYNSSGQVSSQTDPAGNQTTFNYANLNSSTGNGYTLVTDPDGNQTQYVYDSGVLVSKTAGYGSSSPSTWVYQPDSATLLTDLTTDPNGHTTSYSYDAAGNVASKTNPLGNTWTFSYNSFDEPRCTTAPLAASGCSSLSPPSPITAGGTVSPPASAPPKYASYNLYDTAGNPVWSTAGDYNPGSSSASQSRTSYLLYNGESVTLGGSTDSCAASAPSASLPCATIDPNGVVTQLGYDATTGDLTSSSTPDGNSGGELALTTYGYDGDG
jgi:YD repeat-containing protein